MMTPPRVIRRRHGLLAALAAVFFFVGLLGVEQRDDGWLLKVGGARLDLRGSVQAAWQNAWRDCRPMRRALPGDPQVEAALQALREFSPPDSLSAALRQADAWGQGWWVLQAEFDRLEPVIVLVRGSEARTEVVSEGVWSSTTLPWNSAWRIRGFLAGRVPQAPRGLLDCIDPLPLFAQPPRLPG
ncbi:MAG: hypothetical protein EBS47_05990 [Betaproteobacteria bacterium]|nr:hypothetical protein [Betaproteobacteria bacterium]